MQLSAPPPQRCRYEDPQMPLVDIMSDWPETIAVFMRYKMLCVGCLIGPFHTVTDACHAYGLDEDRFRAELAQAITGPVSPD